MTRYKEGNTVNIDGRKFIILSVSERDVNKLGEVPTIYEMTLKEIIE